MVGEASSRLGGEAGRWSQCGWEPQPSLATQFSSWLPGVISELDEHWAWSAYHTWCHKRGSSLSGFSQQYGPPQLHISISVTSNISHTVAASSQVSNAINSATPPLSAKT